MKKRFSILLIVFICSFFAIAARLFYWQIIKGGELSAEASSQYNFTYDVKPKRGDIFFSDKSLAVTSQPGYLLYVNPKLIPDKTAFSDILGPLIPMDPATVSAKLNDQLFWVPIQHKVTEDIKNKIQQAKLPGVGFEPESLRYYPEASMAAHLLGFVGKDVNGLDKGYFGLEGFYDREIKGRGGTLKTISDAFGRPILLAQQEKEPIVNGRSLVLNIDRTVQFFVEQALTKGMEKYGAKGGSVIIMDPKTGGILAMASRPSYDPFTWSEFDDNLFKNPAVASLYEPGSTFKTLVMASAINENLVTPDTTCDICDKPVEVGGYQIRTWNNEYTPNTTMLKTIIHSDNTGMVFTARKLGLDKFYNYIQNFGIGSTTNIDLEDEETPLLRPKDEWKDIDLATASFGQGLAVTPLQMVRAVGAIANGGKLMEPHVVASVIKEDGQELTIHPKVTRQVISEKTAKVVSEMMVAAVEQGEAKFTKIQGYRVAGKTGTAQIPIAGHYDPNKTIASFVGFGPSDDPKFIMLVKLDQPSSSIFGAETAAPLFFEIARQLFMYYKIPPSNY